MGALFSLFLLALPTLLVCVVFLTAQKRGTDRAAIVWLIVGTIWAIATWFWIRYSQQQDDVGLMVEGILAGAMTISALVASLVAICLQWWRSRA